jgi:hypothetical protein
MCINRNVGANDGDNGGAWYNVLKNEMMCTE